MKYEWKKNEKELYGVKQEPVFITVPKQSFIMIQGKGNPNDKTFSEKVSALYSLAYGIKMGYKKSAKDTEIDDFAVYPLEGVWQGGSADGELVKENLEYTIMIKQPEFITKEMVATALDSVKKKKPSPYLDEIYFDTLDSETCVQVLHVGTYDEEPTTFNKMDKFAEENGVKRCAVVHREIYLNNANRVSADKLKTIIRYKVK